MSKSKRNELRTLAIVNAPAAGIDIGLKELWVCLGDNAASDVRCFGTFTCELEALGDWLAAHGVRTVAAEATGVYWIPLFEMLDRRGIEAILVDPSQTRQR